MSLAGRAATRGTTVTIYRSVEAETGDLGRKVSSWTVIVAGYRAIIESETDERMQKVFGTPQIVKDRLYAPGTASSPPPDIQEQDAVVATDGKRVGGKWRVRAVLTLDQSGRPHKEAALESTTETIP